MSVDSTVTQAPVTEEKTTIPMAVYILYLVGFLAGITALVGLVLAYVNRSDASAWLQSHYTFQIRTFWIGLGMLAGPRAVRSGSPGWQWSCRSPPP